jgi:hypothetical protein
MNQLTSRDVRGSRPADPFITRVVECEHCYCFADTRRFNPRFEPTPRRCGVCEPDPKVWHRRQAEVDKRVQDAKEAAAATIPAPDAQHTWLWRSNWGWSAAHLFMHGLADSYCGSVKRTQAVSPVYRAAPAVVRKCPRCESAHAAHYGHMEEGL